MKFHFIIFILIIISHIPEGMADTSFLSREFLKDGVWHDGVEQIHGQKTAIYGQDNRHNMLTGYPWQAVGKVFQGGHYCTGTLVAACVVLTASHCINENLHTTFRGSNNGPSSSVIHYYYNNIDPDKSWGDDWELLVLKNRLGDSLGWLGVFSWSAPDFKKWGVYSLVGYASDLNGGNRATVDNQVTIYKTFANNVIYHDGNSSKGDSGGPILRYRDGEYSVVAIHTRSPEEIFKKYSDAESSVGVSSGAFLSTLNQVIKEWCPN